MLQRSNASRPGLGRQGIELLEAGAQRLGLTTLPENLQRKPPPGRAITRFTSHGQFGGERLLAMAALTLESRPDAERPLIPLQRGAHQIALLQHRIHRIGLRLSRVGAQQPAVSKPLPEQGAGIERCHRPQGRRAGLIQLTPEQGAEPLHQGVVGCGHQVRRRFQHRQGLSRATGGLDQSVAIGIRAHRAHHRRSETEQAIQLQVGSFRLQGRHHAVEITALAHGRRQAEPLLERLRAGGEQRHSPTELLHLSLQLRITQLMHSIQLGTV